MAFLEATRESHELEEEQEQQLGEVVGWEYLEEEPTLGRLLVEL